MYINCRSILLLMLIQFSSSIKNTNHIKNMNFPACKDCKHFLPITSNPIFSGCKKFGIKDLITGQITNYYATTCRSIETYCGEEGKHFLPIVSLGEKPENEKSNPIKDKWLDL